MVTIEDKIKLFSKIVYDKIDEEIEKETEKFEKEKKEILMKEKEKIESYKEKSIKEIRKKSTIKARELISKAKLETQHNRLVLKEEIINNVLEDIKDRLKKYSNSTSYKNFLYENLKIALSEIDSDNFTLYLNKKDFERYSEDIKRELNIRGMEIKELDKEIIGGYIFQNKDNKFRIDGSLDNKVYLNKEKVGIKITEALMQ